MKDNLKIKKRKKERLNELNNVQQCVRARLDLYPFIDQVKDDNTSPYLKL